MSKQDMSKEREGCSESQVHPRHNEDGACGGRPQLTEQEIAEAFAPCGSQAIGISLQENELTGPDRAPLHSDMISVAHHGKQETGIHAALSTQQYPHVMAHPEDLSGTHLHGYGDHFKSHQDTSGRYPKSHPSAHPHTGGAHLGDHLHAAGHPGAHPHPHAGGGHPMGHPSGLQRHGGSRSRGFRPGGGRQAIEYQEKTGVKAPRIIAWELTRSCNLSCVHCRAASEFGHYPGELSTEEIKQTIDNIASITNPIFILTGGEPLLRPDIWEIIDYAHEKGTSPVVSTNGTLLTPEIARKLKEHDIPRISVSIDFPNKELHDKFRGQEGAFEASIQGIKYVKDAGVGVQINTTVTKMNNHLLEEMHDLALSLHVDAFHIFLLVPTGRGEDLIDVELTPEEYEAALTWAYDRQKTSPLHFKPTDAPQYYRIIHQKARAEGSQVSAEQYGLDAITRGCLGGITFCFISHTGDIQPCGYFNLQCGNVKEKPFSEIWTHSPVLNDLRTYSLLKGKCGACEYKGVCGGCRARALAATGDYMEEEPYCAYVPKRYREAGKTANAHRLARNPQEES